MITALLVSLWAGICSVDDSTTQMLRRPLPICTVVGLLMGDVTQGLIIGATLEIMWMGIGNVGAYVAPDIITGAIVATSIAISSGGGVATAITLAVPTSLLTQQLIVLFRTANCALNNWAERMADEANFKKTFWLNVPSIIGIFFIRAVPTFLAIYFGSGLIEGIVNQLPKVVMGGLAVSGKMIPAIGIGLLMMMMIKDAKMWVFLILGFVLSSYLKLSILPISLIALTFAFLYDLAISKPQVVNGNLEEEEYEL